VNKDRLTAFTDAVLAIVMTLLVIEISQPAKATWQAIWDLRQSYLAYAISFLWLAAMWNNHHHIFQLVRRVDGRVLWVNMLMLFSASLFPYTTRFVDENFEALVAQLVYGAVFLAVTLANFGLYLTLIRADPDNRPLRYAAGHHRKMATDLGIKLLGFLIGVLAYPPAITLSMLIAMLLYVVPERRAETAISI
jgi:uncharacterized membrane protein